MTKKTGSLLSAMLLGGSLLIPALHAQPVEAWKEGVVAGVTLRQKQAQVMNDMIFSFSELGFHEVETSKYLTDLLEKEGFTIERGVAGIPTAWVATWSQGTGKPVIALGSDLDGIPLSSQKPGVSYRDEIVPGAPGHGEGHNSGQVVNIIAALAVRDVMKRENLSGTIKLWPGVAEELLGTKAYLVRAGVFDGVDICLFSHVSSNFGIAWGSTEATGLVSVEYTFSGQSAHSAGAPWRGRSALDAVELMNVGWNFKREHLRLQQRSHYVITNGGDQPNVVPSVATVWYYFRETDYPRIKAMWEAGDATAQGAALMTGTTVKSRLLGAAWPQHMNKVVAEVAYENVKRVGLPEWTEDDQTLAKAVQREAGQFPSGLPIVVGGLTAPISDDDKRGGGSDDIGDISWTVPTITLRYPSNIPNLAGHHWTSSIAMATPIAHKGVVAGAKVQALTMLDFLTRPELVTQAWDYFRTVQTKDMKYTSFLRPEDKPAIWLNDGLMARFRDQLKPFHFDPTKYETYLEQLGVVYPMTVKPAAP